MHNQPRRVNWWYFFLSIVCFWAVASMLGGCTMAQKRTTAHGVETVGIAYTALITTMAIHEAGHWQTGAIDGLNPNNLRIDPQFYRVWEIPQKNWNGVDWSIAPKYDLHDGRFIVRHWRYTSPEQVRRESENIRRKDIHASLAGLAMTDRFFMAIDQGLQAGSIEGQFPHAIALFLSLDPIIYSVRDYRGFNELRYGNGDLHDYFVDMGIDDRTTLRNAAILDLIGKGPDIWWHAKGMVGINDPPPRSWQFGAWEVRPGIVIAEWRYGWGVNAALSF